jgi:hypothetical protein
MVTSAAQPSWLAPGGVGEEGGAVAGIAGDAAASSTRLECRDEQAFQAREFEDQTDYSLIF